MQDGRDWHVDRSIPVAIVWLVICQVVAGAFGVGLVYAKVSADDDRLAGIESRLDRIENNWRGVRP